MLLPPGPSSVRYGRARAARWDNLDASDDDEPPPAKGKGKGPPPSAPKVRWAILSIAACLRESYILHAYSVYSVRTVSIRAIWPMCETCRDYPLRKSDQLVWYHLLYTTVRWGDRVRAALQHRTPTINKTQESHAPRTPPFNVP